MLSTRLLFGFSMIGAFLLILIGDEWLAPWYPLWFVLALVALGTAALELVGLLNETSARASGNTVLGGVTALVVANWAPHVAHAYLLPRGLPTHSIHDPLGPISALGWPFLTFVGIVMAAFLAQSIQFERPGKTVAALSGTILGVAYVGLLGSFIVQLRWLDGRYHGIIPIAFLVATAKGADTGAYTVGRIMGRHKLWPSLSPKKTVEGAIGGLVFGTGAAVLVALIARSLLHIPTFSTAAAAGFGVFVGTAAQLGDLMESMIKRDCMKKDASGAVPGYGGVLDVLDSLLFAAPVAFAYWLWFGP